MTGQNPVKTRRSFLYPAMLFIPGCTALALAAWSAASSPAMASILGMGSVTPPIHSQSWSLAEIAKPTSTPLPTALPSSTPTATLEPSVTPGALYAEFVPDTPTPEVRSYPAPAADDSAVVGNGGDKHILVDISEQHLYAYEGDTLVFSFVASTGMHNATAVGSFSVLSKIPDAYGATWNIWMPNWLGIYWAGGLQNGIHALPILPNGAQLWSGYLGTPISYGCVVLGASESLSLYDWAEIGTPVDIQW